MTEAATKSAPPTAAPLTGGVLVRVYLRSLWLQAAWNAEGMQNLGFAYAIWPALARLYPPAAARAEALERHLEAFNTHPYAAAAALGASVHHEERASRGLEPAAEVASFKRIVMGPLAALGDGFFWLALRPALMALAVFLSILFGVWPLIGCVVLYNGYQLWFRAHYLRMGYCMGDRVIEALSRARLPRKAGALRLLAAGAAGAAAGLWMIRAAGFVGSRTWETGVLPAGAALFAGAYVATRWLSPRAVLFLAAVAGIAIGRLAG